MYRAGKGRVEHEHSFVLANRPEDIFPLLCPVREYDWLDGWACKMVRSDSGVAEDGCVFITDLGRGKEVWVCTRYEPPHHIEYVAVCDGSHVMRLVVDLAPEAHGRTRLAWRRGFTSLGEQGDLVLSIMTEESLRLQETNLERALVHYLDTGKMLPLGRTWAEHGSGLQKS